MRFVHVIVICLLVFAAAHVYRIKMESTARTEKVLKLQTEIREQRDAIASLRAEWARLDAPARLQRLAEKHLDTRPIAASQFDKIGNLPMRPQDDSRPSAADPLSAMIDGIDSDIITGTLPVPPVSRPEAPR